MAEGGGMGWPPGDQGMIVGLQSSLGPRRRISCLRLVMLLGAISLSCRSSPVEDRAHTPVEQWQPAAVSSPSATSAPSARSAPSAPSVVKLSCGEVSACADRCAAGCPGDIRKIGCLYSCTHDCRSEGCDSAVDPFDGLTDCIQKNCLIACMGGPSPDCRGCTEQECTEETQRCHSHHCEASRPR